MRFIQIELPTNNFSLSLKFLRNSLTVSRIFVSAPAGRSCATPPGRTYAIFIRKPATNSNTSKTFSRSRKAKIIGDNAPSSSAPVPSATMCDEIRLNSIIITRITVARSGTSLVMPSNFSTPKQYAVSLNSGAK
ncbi:unannotated protein [freshwater metagenome]|uniref:Unannotated protein n=1 Tax=freshwater metagenome TaxID=449393 RepID=A0A6J6HM39_9ZZZZ